MRWLDMCGAGVEMVVNGVVLHVLVDGDSDSESVSYSRKFPDWSAAPARGGNTIPPEPFKNTNPGFECGLAVHDSRLLAVR